MNIIFNVENQIINCVKNYEAVADSREYLKARFIFTPDWDGCAKTAVFAGDGKTYEMLLENDTCAVPHEVLGGSFEVSVFGVDGVKRITTDSVRISVRKSGFAEGETPSDPTPTVYEQLLGKINDTAKLAENKADKESLNEETAARMAADNSLEQNKADKTALAAKADKSYNSGFIGGTGAKLNGVGGAAVGQDAQASLGAALGKGTQASAGAAAGENAYASHGAALGRDTKTLHGVAAGDGAQTVDEDGNPITAIQLGGGTNTEPNTAKFFDYTIMDADGTVPRERIPDAVNRYDVSALPSKSQTYDFSDGVSKFIAVERMDVAVESETQVMMSASNAGNKYGLAQFDFGSITAGATRIIAEYDTKYDGGRWEISLVDMSKRPGTSDKSSYDTAGVAFRTGTRDANNNFYLNGDNKYDTTLNNVWVHVKADIDLTAGTLKYEISAEGTLKYSGEIAVPESVGTIDGLEIYTWAQGTIYADNIKINALYDVDENGLYVTDEGQYIYKDGEPVALGADMNDYYTKSYLDDKFSGYDTQMMMMNESVMGKAELYDFNQLSKTVAAKADKTAVTSVSGASPSVTLTDNTETRCGEVTALTLNLPSDTDTAYKSSIVFTSGEAAAQLTVPENMKCIGTDCANGVFTPQANMRYIIDVRYDGEYFVSETRGFAV